MPKEVADALKKQGHWKDDYGARSAGAPAALRAAQTAPQPEQATPPAKPGVSP
jgi:cytochrome c-type biogenesis protein CcmE